MDNEDINIVTSFLTLAQSPSPVETAAKSSGDVRLGRAVMEEFGKVIKSKDVSLQMKDKTIHTRVCPITLYRCEGWTVIGEKLIHLKDGVGGALDGYPGLKEKCLVGPRPNLALKKTDILFQAHHEKAGFLGKDSDAGKTSRKANHEMDWLHQSSHRHEFMGVYGGLWESVGSEQGCWGLEDRINSISSHFNIRFIPGSFYWIGDL